MQDILVVCRRFPDSRVVTGEAQRLRTKEELTAVDGIGTCRADKASCYILYTTFLADTADCHNAICRLTSCIPVVSTCILAAACSCIRRTGGSYRTCS